MNILPLFIAVPLGLAFIIPIVGKKFKYLPDLLANLTTLVLVLLSGLVLGNRSIYEMGKWPPPFGIVLVLDGLSALMLLIISVISFMATLYSARYIERYTDIRRYYSLFLLMVAGMNGVVLTGDMFNLFVFMEIAAIASYALVAFGCQHEELEASFKYLVLGSVASIFILFGIALLYGLTGTLNMADIANKLTGGNLILFSLSLFVMGFGLKGALVPFHAWLPDAHPSAPAPISAMLSGVVIKALGVYALARIIFNVFGLSGVASEVLLILGTISMLIGSFLAIGQWDIKRLLAYSSISQIGYIILGIGLGTPLGILGGLFHLVNHAVFKSLLFLDAGSIEYATGTRRLDKMGGLAQKMHVTGFSSMVASLSISGIPPFSGFWSKLIIIWACVEAGRPVYALWATLTGIITIAYYMKVQRYAFLGKLGDAWTNIKEVPGLMRVAMIILALLCFSMGLMLLPGLRDTILVPAVRALTDGNGYIRLVLG
jgi:multicomponent Na+:H+ antiporter subunit D